MIQTQTIETPSGMPLPDKYAAMIKSNGRGPHRMPPPANKLRMFLHGPVGSGKTFFAASIPRACLLDFEDKTSAVRKWAPGTVPFTFKTAEEYEKLIAELVDDGRAGRPPFDTVVFDTTLSYIRMTRDALSRLYREAGLLKFKFVDVVDYGKEGSGWDRVNQAVRQPFDLLTQAGYGWVALAHMMPTWRKTDHGEVFDWESVINQGVLRYLYSQCEYAMTFGKQTRVELVHQKPRSIKLPNGQTIEDRGEDIEVSKTVYVLRRDVGDSLPWRQSIPLGESPIELPEANGYGAFASRYSEAVKAWENPGDGSVTNNVRT